MPAEVASAFVSLLPSTRGFGRALDRQIGPDINRAASKSGRTFGTVFARSSAGPIKAGFGSIGKFAAGAFAGVAVAGGLRTVITAASDLGETMSKVTQIFGGEAVPALEKFAGTAAKSIGQSKQAALDAAATFATFGKSAGLSGENLVGFSTQLTSLSSDLASFHNTSPEDAVIAIGAALRGEMEPIRRYNVLLDDASLRQEAMRQGIIKTTKQALTPQQKVLAVQALIYKQTADAQGDFIKTSGGLANQQRILQAQLRDTVATLGQKLLPVAVKVTSAFSDFVTGITTNSGQINSSGSRFAAWGAKLRTVFVNQILPAAKGFWRFLVDDLKPALGDLARAVGTGLTQAMANFSKAFGGTVDGAGAAKGVFSGFGDLITKVIIPAVAKFYEVYLPALGTALGYAARFAVTLAEAYVFMALTGLRAFRELATGALVSFGAILAAADKVRFLFPSMAGAIHAAANNFEVFAERTIANLHKAERSIVDVQVALAGLRSKDVFVNIITTTRGATAGGQSVRGIAEGRARTIARDEDARIASRARDQAAAISRAVRVTGNAARGVAPTYRAIGASAGTALGKGMDEGKKIAAQKSADLAKAAVDKAKDALSEARRQLQDYAKGVADSIRSFGDVTNVGQSGAAATPNSIQRFLRNQLASITAFQRNLKALARRGISASLLRQIADAGPEQGGPVAAALVKASGKQFAEITALDKKISGTATAVGNMAAQRLQGGAVAPAIENVNVTINNPLPERASTTAPKAVRRALLAAS